MCLPSKWGPITVIRVSHFFPGHSSSFDIKVAVLSRYVSSLTVWLIELRFYSFLFFVHISVMFSCCLFYSSVFLYVFIVYLYFYFCAASWHNKEWWLAIRPGTFARVLWWLTELASLLPSHLCRIWIIVAKLTLLLSATAEKWRKVLKLCRMNFFSDTRNCQTV